MAEPLCRKPAGKATWAWILSGTCGLVVVATLLVVWMPRARRMAVFVLLTLWCHGPLSPFLPAAYEPVLLAYGRLLSPWLVAMVGAFSSTAVEYVNYYLYRRLLRYEAFERVLQGSSSRRVVTLFSRRPFFTVWLCIWSPLPDWAARVLAAHSGYSVGRYLAAVLLARLPRFWFLAALGLQLRLGIGTLVVIAIGSALVAISGGLHRRGRPTARLPRSFPGGLVQSRSLIRQADPGVEVASRL